MSSIMQILRRIGGAKSVPTSGSEGQLAAWKAGKAAADAASLYLHDGVQWCELVDTAAQWAHNGSDISRMAGNVGIGVAAPSQKLEVAGVIKSGATGVNGSVSVSRKSDGAITAGVSWDDVRNAMVLNSAVGDMIFEIGSFERARLDARFNFLLTSTGCLGYGTGSGGMVTQTTSKSTDMALNRSNGQLVLNASSIPANGAVSFMVVNNLVADTDMIHITIKSGSGSVGGYVFTTAVGTGAFIVAIRNLSGSPLAEALVLNFAIFKGVTA